MSEGVITVLISSGASLLIAFLVQFVARRTAKDTTDTSRLELSLDAVFKRAESAEARVAALEAKDAEKESRIKVLEEKDAARERQLARIRQVVQDWMTVLKREWAAFTDKPMPMPPDEDLDLLGITKPRRRRSNG